MIDGKNIIAIEPSKDESNNDILIAKTFDRVRVIDSTPQGGSYDGESDFLKKYEPTISIDGEVYEAPNLLTQFVKEKFVYNYSK